MVGTSYLSLLQAVAARCGLPYASVVFERAGDGTPVYGVEIDVPCFGAVVASRTVADPLLCLGIPSHTQHFGKK